MNNSNYFPWTSEWRNTLARELDGLGHPAQHTGERWLAAIIGTSLVLALVLFLSGGYQTGFATMNPWGAHLPPVLWELITFGGDGLFAVVLLLPFARRYPQILWAGAIAAILGAIFTHSIKYGLSLPRPPGVLEDGSFHLVGRGYRRGSFPSGHAMTIFTVACLAIYHARSQALRAVLLLGALLIGFSRVFVGVHWPIDVLVSAGAAALAVWLGVMLSRRWRWGMRPTGHLVLVGILTASAVALFGHDGDYPSALWLANATAALALAIVLWDYLIQPLRQRRARTTNPVETVGGDRSTTP